MVLRTVRLFDFARIEVFCREINLAEDFCSFYTKKALRIASKGFYTCIGLFALIQASF